jgi:Tol biopolymer transport system component/tRNA A-37 threonylcarbamoyl transferase component Bud32
MPLSPATRLGPYEILSPIGAGGMGEVYRARDTRLDRTVAIKVLHEDRYGTPQARERFEREAKTISSLNHPHICTLHDVGHQNGIDFLVMEYLEGETLAHRLKKGPLPLDQVLQYAIQITDALDTAHKHGVIHRDLKPGNIMLTKTGAKLLDFGLAKVRAAEAAAGMTGAPTQTTPLTGEGTILGTLQYMAPEQLEGAEADARTDIFAFGAVMYEMATGRKAFAGKSQASVISAIMTTDPPPISTLQGMTPPALDHVARSCLAKEPDTRWQTAHDVLLQLKWIADAGSHGGVPGPVAARRKSWQLLSWVLTTVVSIAFLVLAVVHFRERSSEVHRVRFLVPLPNKLRLNWLDIPVVSPDGQRFVFAAENTEGQRLLWVRSLDSFAAEPLAGTEGAFSPFWSPDSRFVAFRVEGNKLKKVDASGGPVHTLCETPRYGTPGTWSQDGDILLPAPSGLLRLASARGEVSAALELDPSRQETNQRFPQFLPDGRHFLYVSVSATASKTGIRLGMLGSKENRLLISADSNVRYVSPGFLIYSREETLLAQPFDATKLQLTGEPFPIAEHVARIPAFLSGQFAGSAFSASDTGVLMYRSSGSSNPQQLAWQGRDGKRLQAVGEPGEYRQMVLSPDEKRLVVERLDPLKGGADIWVLELSTGIFSRLTFDAQERDPVWSPDSRELIFSSNRIGKTGLYRKMVGGGDEKLVYGSDDGVSAYKWLKDGRSILFINGRGKTFYQLSLTGEGKPVTLLTSEFDKDMPRVSPDERWVAYDSLESGRWEVYVATFPAFTEKRQVSAGGGCQPLWRNDGKEIFYLSLDGKLMATDVTGGAALRTLLPHALFQTPVSVSAIFSQYTVTADGKRFLFGEPINQGAEQITVVLNWAAGLKR